MLRSVPFRVAFAALLLAPLAGPASAQQSLGTFAGTLDGPFRIEQLDNGRVLVSEGRSTQVTAFDADGTDREVFGSALNNPTALLQLGDGSVLVGTQGGQGRLALIGDTGSGSVFADDLGTPRDAIGLDDNGDGSADRFLVVDGSSEGRVVEVSANGTISDASFITGLESPGGIVQLSDGRLLVTEGATGRVLAYQADGTDEEVFATGLGAPNDITQVADGRVLVVSSDDNPSNDASDEAAADGDVAIFSAAGTRQGTLVDDLIRPAGVAQLADGRVLVSVFNGPSTAGATGEILAFGLPTSSNPSGPALATIGLPTPNPTAGFSTLDVSVDASQRVRVSVYDVLGREAAVAFDGPVAAGGPVAVALDVERLAPGTYVVRVAGERFAEVRRITVVR